MQRRSVIFVVIAVLFVTLVCSTYAVSAAPVTRGPRSCEMLPPTAAGGGSQDLRRCCQTETDDEGIEITWCVVCNLSLPEGSSCGPRYQALDSSTPPPPQPTGPFAPLQDGVLEQPPTSQPLGPFAPLEGGMLDQQEQGEGAAPPFVPGFLERQQLQPPPAEQGAAELPPPPTTEGTQPATVEEEQPVPVCQEGLEFNEDLGFCVLEEPEAAEEEPAQSEPEEENQPSEELDSVEDNGNN